MKSTPLIVLIPVLGVFMASFSRQLDAQPAPEWPQFRGPGGSAQGTGTPPVEFGPERNVLWKTPLPPGHSSPIIAGNRIFLTAFNRPALETLCLDRASGRILWRRAAPACQIEKHHRTNNPAASTPCTDGRRVFSYFGSFGLLAYDFEGNELWRVPLPTPKLEFGTGTSPICVRGKVILCVDQDSDSFLLALDAATGRQLWKVDRSEYRRSWSTPFVWTHDRGEELIILGAAVLTSYALDNGAMNWTVEGTAMMTCTTPASGGGLLFAASMVTGDGGRHEETDAPPKQRRQGPAFSWYLQRYDRDNDGRLSQAEGGALGYAFRFDPLDLNKDGFITAAEFEKLGSIRARSENSVFAVRPGGRGEVTATHVVWKGTQGVPYVPSPLYYDGHLYLVKTGGMLNCLDAKTGTPRYPQVRLKAGGDYYASPVAADGRIYVASVPGIVTAFRAGPAFELLATNKFDDRIFRTPAIVAGVIYLRTEHALYAFGNRNQPNQTRTAKESKP